MMAKFAVPLVLIGIAVLLFAVSPSQSALRRGQKLPEMQMKDLAGKEVKLGGRQEKVYLVDFWATWCGPCRESMPFFQELHDKYASRGLEVVGVALQSGTEQEVRAFIESNKITYRIVVPTNESDVMRRYKVEAFPTMYIVDKKGVIRYTEVGYSDELREEILRVIGQALAE
ncbi:MAG: TlpA disulfide reductase family protein [Fimbriimonadales bacterium]